MQQISVKNRVFLHFIKTLVGCFTPQKISFFLKIVSDLQLFVDKSLFLEEKAHFFGSKTGNQRFGEVQKKRVFY